MEPNAIGRTLGLLGDEWSLLIVRYAFAGVRRFRDWRARLGISDAVLAARLRALVDGGVLERRTTGGAYAEYQLTRSGLALWGLLLSIWSWELRHVPGQSGRLPRMVHRGCESEFEPVLRCRGCHGAAPLEEVHLGLGPSGDFARSAPVGSNRRRSGGRRTDRSGAGMFPETMTLIGSRWSSSLLGAAVVGATRFSEFERMVGAPPAVVAERLRTFVDLGVLAPVEAEPGDRSRYRLTLKGRALFPVVAAAVAWGEWHFPSVEGPAVVAVHRACGAAFTPELACSVCEQPITRSALLVSPADVSAAGVPGREQG